MCSQSVHTPHTGIHIATCGIHETYMRTGEKNSQTKDIKPVYAQTHTDVFISKQDSMRQLFKAAKGGGTKPLLLQAF